MPIPLCVPNTWDARDLKQKYTHKYTTKRVGQSYGILKKSEPTLKLSGEQLRFL